ncbi:MAG TPA: hypothetical protein VG709_07060 [Actinomycetota bacterium]|nr:hypothetical protein [Actinomycetota bacterium]
MRQSRLRIMTAGATARGWSTAIVAVVVLASALTVLVGRAVREESNRPSIAVPPRNARPIAGRAVRWAVAEREAAMELPRLPEMELADPCTGGLASISLRRVWSSGAGRDWHIGVNYTHGLWMTIAAAHRFNHARERELRPLRAAFPPFDFPEGLRDGEVRGHVAWIGDLNPSFRCSRSATNPGRDWFIFDPARTGSITWKERAAVLELSGPYRAETLASLAGEAHWSRPHQPARRHVGRADRSRARS